MSKMAWIRQTAFWGALLATTVCAPSESKAQSGVPPYMDVIVSAAVPSPAMTARQNILALNTGMFELYGEAGQLVQGSILAQHPVILGLFSGDGGRFILYRPGKAPLDGPAVPEVYQLLKSVGHSVMALGVVVGPHIGKPEDQSWRPSLASYRVRLKAALDSIDETTMPAAWRENNRALIAENIAFIDKSLADGVISFAAVQAFAAKQKEPLKLNIQWAADTQVKHWMGVLADWKQQLGPDWGRVYAASNTIYVARQNNVLFSVLAQFFAPEDINSRLILIETVSFTTTPLGHAGVADADHLGPYGGGDVFRQCLPDGLRADGRRCARHDRGGDKGAGDDNATAAAGAVRFAPVADAGDSWRRAGLARRSALGPNTTAKKTQAG